VITVVQQPGNVLRLQDQDLDFLIEAAAPHVVDRVRLKKILREDEGFRNSFISDEKVFRRLMDDDEILLKISPPLFFEILLRKTVKELEKTEYTFEKTSTAKIPVFDTREVVNLLSKESLLLYLAHMLSSFTRIENYNIFFKGETGAWVRFQFNDLDIFTLMDLSTAVDEEHRLGFYKRIADICLFILGLFPEYAEREYRYPFSGQVRPQIRGKVRIGPEDYFKEGQKFYKLAAEHESAREMNLSEVFWTLHEHFEKAKKPLNFIADHYLHFKKYKFFG
jgi:hypothetical protein